MNKDIIVRLEALVESISECYTSIPTEKVEELNELTKNSWSEEEYIEYCAEYWSCSTLEETVYALLHDGEYPENVIEKIYLWKKKQDIALSDKSIMFKLRKLPEVIDEEVNTHFEDLPIREVYDMLKIYLCNWSVDKEIEDNEIDQGSFDITFSDERIAEYAKYKYVIFKVSGKKLISFLCCNLDKNEKQAISSIAEKQEIYMYEK